MYLLLFFCVISSTQRIVCGDKSEWLTKLDQTPSNDKNDQRTSWDQLRVKFQSYEHMPLWKKHAKAKGWLPNGNGCRTKSRLSFVGERYTQPGDQTTHLLYGENGKLVGIQAMINTTQRYPSRKESFPWIFTDHTKSKAVLTAYFRNPKKICDDDDDDDDKPCNMIGGDTIYIQKLWKKKHDDHFHVKTEKLPRNLKDLKKDKKWVQGKCFTEMGLHYWYGINQNTSCDNLFPIFLLFNDNTLKSFGWAVTTFISSSRWSYPTPPYFPYFFDINTIPKCLYNNDVKISTQHIYVTNHTKLTC